ncbi:MAG: class I SAM-dependent methyltransferase [Actinomycetota bacterium]|nr:class I SAM-dependent methyltransferase [Actinomycetota bacterium]
MKRSEEIAAALRRHGADPGAAAVLERVLEALEREPDPHSTVRVADFVDVHVADSLAGLAVQPLREATAIADVGAGAGFPGLVLAAVLTRARVDLIESASRKVALMERLAAAGELRNARAVAARAEEWGAGEGREAYDAVTARAVGPLAVLAEYAAPLLCFGGVLVAWKGQRDDAEEDAGAAAAERLGLEPRVALPVAPYEGSRSRHLHVYEKVAETPPGFPRRPGMAVKRPLA